MGNTKKIAIILSGCGQYDGSEIHEAVCAMLAIDMNGAEYDIYAADKAQHHVINHFTGDEMKETRNVLIESARMARGKAKSLANLEVANYDALVMPGGHGAAKNLSDYAFNGDAMTVDPLLANCIKKAHAAGIPIGAMCIAPMILAKVLGHVKLTLGGENKASGHAKNLGSETEITTAGQVCVDAVNKIVTTPCYMVDSRISEVLAGADGMIKEILKMLS